MAIQCERMLGLHVAVTFYQNMRFVSKVGIRDIMRKPFRQYMSEQIKQKRVGEQKDVLHGGLLSAAEWASLCCRVG